MIAEVIGGIILGPTVLGRVPGFTAHIFPPVSVSYLNLIATIGLVLFLFLVGLEVDVGIIRRDWKAATAISVVGLVIPFGVGAGIAVPIYNQFIKAEDVSFGHFLLFVAVALSITAFPVLCRILTETKLLETRVGVIVLSAGVGNDVVGWILLALTIALVNASSGVTAVYILLCAVGWTLFILIPVKRAFHWLCRRSGSFDDDHGPTPGVMLVLLLIVFISAFFTDIIGVHPIFGGFLAGLIVPHEHGFARKVAEKLDDLVSLIFLPIYFVLSGLNTNLGLLDDGITWGYVVAICVVAFFGKFIGCAVVARALKFTWRESGAIGTLMSCKGLVELIVLNVGLAAGILDPRVFSMFVLMAIVCTVVTTPLTLWVYPPKYQTRVNPLGHPNGNGHGNKKDEEGKGRHVSRITSSTSLNASGVRDYTSKFMIVLQKYEHLSAMMFLMQLLEPPPVPTPAYSKDSLTRITTASSTFPTRTEKEVDSEFSEVGGNHTPSGFENTADGTTPTSRPTLDALRLTELTGRTHSVMQSIETDVHAKSDELLQLTRQFGELRGFEVKTRLTVVPLDSYSATVSEIARDSGSELIILPWTTPDSGASGAVIEENATYGIEPASQPTTPSPFDTIFGSGNQSQYYSYFLRRVFAQSSVDVALFIDRGFNAMSSSHGYKQHIFLPFFGGPDDRMALGLAVQLCRQVNVSATVVRFKTDTSTLEPPAPAPVLGRRHHSKSTSSVTQSQSPSQELNKDVLMEESIALHQKAFSANLLPFGGTPTRATNPVVSHSNDDLTWSYFTEPHVSDDSQHSTELRQSLNRISFNTIATTQPLQTMIDQASDVVERTNIGSWRPLLVLTGRGRRDSANDVGRELTRILSLQGYSPAVGAEIRKTTGDIATALVVSGTKAASASFLVVQSADVQI